MKKLVPTVLLTVCLIGTLILGLKFQPVKTLCNIYILSTGVLGTDKIEQTGEIFRFTGNITECITVYADNIIIDGCGFTLEGDPPTSPSGIEVINAHNVTIKNLTIRGFMTGVSTHRSTVINLFSNNISVGCVQETQAGIYAFRSSDIRISGNRFFNNSRGIWVDYSNNVDISGNEFVDNDGQIDLDFSVNNTISENNLANSTRQSILLYHSSNNSICENNITNERNTTLDYGKGIGLFAYSENNTLSGNNITNSDYGIRLHCSNCNVISGNNIIENREGVHLEFSSDNKFFNNNFINNTLHVNTTSFSYANIWTDGYPIGNYWSNYTDADLLSGPYQNETGSDGIWDNPYIIDENNIDQYPIVPEFPSIMILSLFMLTTLLVVLYQRKKYS